MSKKRINVHEMPDPPESNGDVALTNPATPRKPRAKRPYILELHGDVCDHEWLTGTDGKYHCKKCGIAQDAIVEKWGWGWRTVELCPDFDAIDAAHDWAVEHNLPKADYRVVRVMSEFSVDTVTETRTVLKAK